MLPKHLARNVNRAVRSAHTDSARINFRALCTLRIHPIVVCNTIFKSVTRAVERRLHRNIALRTTISRRHSCRVPVKSIRGARLVIDAVAADVVAVDEAFGHDVDGGLAGAAAAVAVGGLGFDFAHVLALVRESERCVVWLSGIEWAYGNHIGRESGCGADSCDHSSDGGCEPL